jgi:hypothetical protein
VNDDEIWLLGVKGEWTVYPQTVCLVTGTIYHERLVINGDRTEYPCCDLTYEVKRV